jgi:TolA-binding protein
MAVLFLLLAFLLVVVIGAAGLENTDPSSVTLFDRSFSQLSEGQLLVLVAGLGFLVALFLFLAFGASRTRRSRRKELKSRRRDAEGRVDELERENARLQHELTNTREKLDAIDRSRSDAEAERDRAEATADRVRSDAAAHREPPEPTSVRRERLDDRTGISPAHDEHARAADEHARAAEEHARAAADEEARRR